VKRRPKHKNRGNYKPQRSVFHEPGPPLRILCASNSAHPLGIIAVWLMATKVLLTTDRICMQKLNAFSFVAVGLLVCLLYVLAVFVSSEWHGNSIEPVAGETINHAPTDLFRANVRARKLNQH
jgi:hypothetical protein